MKTATASVSVNDELFHFTLALTLFSGRCHTTVAMDIFLQEPTSQGWHQAFNRRVSMKHPTLTKLADCILREQSHFELDIERIRVGQEPKPQKKIYATLDSRLKRVVVSYNFESVNDYLANIAANVKLNC